jgi:hypothetical protein
MSFDSADFVIEINGRLHPNSADTYDRWMEKFPNLKLDHDVIEGLEVLFPKCKLKTRWFTGLEVGTISACSLDPDHLKEICTELFGKDGYSVYVSSFLLIYL